MKTRVPCPTPFARMLALALAAGLCTLPLGCDAPLDAPLAVGPEETGVDGLTLAVGDDRVEGSLVRGDATIDFVIERDGPVRTARLSASDGAPLLESIAEAGEETVTLFGGRAVLTGDPAGEPHVDGDASALDELKAMPEATPIAELHAALEEAGVDPVLLGAEPADDEVAPRLYNDGTYWNLDYGESVTVGTWGWITYTTIVMRHYNWLPICVQFKAGLGAWADFCGPALVENKRSYQFWGALLTIKNQNPFINVKVRTY